MKRAAWRTTASSGLLMLGLIVTGSTGCSGGDGTSSQTHQGAQGSALANGPDLVITDMVVPPSFRTSTFPYSQAPKASITVCNRGTEDSSSTMVQLYISMDDTLTPMGGPIPPPVPPMDQAPLGQAYLPHLYRGQCRTVSTELWPTLPPDANGDPGAYYIGAIVDEQDNVLEAREDNNAFVKGLVGVGNGPDLVITDMNVPPGLRTDGFPGQQQPTAQVTVCNQGTQDSPSTRVRLYVSMDDVLTATGPNPPPQPVTDQVLVGDASVPHLFVGHCTTVSTPISTHLPPDANGAEGAYYVGAIVDEQDAAEELREDNNAFVKGLVGVGQGPDLVVTDMNVPPSLRTGGFPSSQQPKATVTVCNQGTQDSPSSRVQLYVSLDRELTPMGGPNPPPQPATDQALLGDAYVPNLFPGRCATVTANLIPTLPPNANGAVGAYYVGAIVDEQDFAQELREDNNTFIEGLVGFGSGADLVITDMNVPPSLRTSGFPSSQPPTATVTVCNQGTEDSSSTMVQLYVSMDRELTAMGGPTPPPFPPMDQSMLGQAYVPHLFRGQCRTVSTELWTGLPPDSHGNPGAYYVGAIIDEQDNVLELREDNNAFVKGLVGVGDGPDLVITDMSVPASFTAGTPPWWFSAKAQVTVCNQGTQDSPSTRVQLYVSMDRELTAMGGPNPPPYPAFDQAPLGDVYVPHLFAGRCTTVTANLSPSLPVEANGAEGAYYVGAIVDEQDAAEELREDNNAFVKGLVGVGNGPDLVITDMNVPPSLRTGGFPSSQQPKATVTVCNQGMQNSPSSRVQLYVSLDRELTPMGGPNPPPYPAMDQAPIGDAYVPNLFPGRCATVTANLTPSLPPEANGNPGAYYVGAIVDEQDFAQELREDNNTFIEGLVGFGSGADLVITDMNVPPSLRTSGSPSSQPPTATVTVCNQGTEDSSSTMVQLYVSMDRELTAMGGPTPPPFPPMDQSMLGQAYVPHLFRGQCRTVSTELWTGLPPDSHGNPGAYYVGAIIDEQDNVLELREDNNAFVKGLVGVGNGPDLVITDMNVPPSLRTGGFPGQQQPKAQVTVCNQGTQDSPSTRVQLYVSIDDTLTAMGPNGPSYPAFDQAPLGDVYVPHLFAGRCTTVTANLSPMLPPDANGAAGAYYVGAIVDEQDAAEELREDNNAFVKGLVGVGQGPDLVITDMNVPPSLRASGFPSSQQPTATVKVCNQGTQDSPSSRVQLYVSLDRELTPMGGPNPPPYPAMDQAPIGDAYVPNLFPGRCATVTANLIPSLPPEANGNPGAYYVGAIVDEQGFAQELREDNNTFIEGLVGFGSGADLVITDMNVPPSLRTSGFPSSQPPTATVTVCNQGTEDSSSTMVQLYVSMDRELTAMGGPTPPPFPPMDQSMLGQAYVPHLFAGACATVSTELWTGLPPDSHGNPGTYYVGAIVDEQNNVLELREDNNAFIEGLVGFGDGPDLVVTDLGVPTSFRVSGFPGQQVNATVTVCNQGTQDSMSTQVQLYLSMDQELTSMGPGAPPYPAMDQAPLGLANVPHLLPGSCTTIPTLLSPQLPPEANGNPGAYYVGAIVDEYDNALELREDNNTFIEGLVGVGDGPDLVVTALTGPSFVRMGNSFTATVTVCNQGTQPSQSSSVYLYTSLGTVLTADSGMPSQDQTVIGVANLNSLNPSSCSVQPLTVSASLPPGAMGMTGAYHLGAYADASESLQELREDNNTRVTGLFITP
ncbi:CARDB domain-containing protein [Myxococcus fulvus]|uniref:CARDB domain-containing protein n=1 Tax=Myxococcus fulvus TaxID=33 RepID=UPI003B9960CD